MIRGTFHLIFVLLITFSLSLFSQNNRYEIRTHSLIVSPLNPFDFLNPSLQLGYEKSLNNYIVRLEGGVILKHSVFGYMGMKLSNGHENYSYEGYKVRGELQRILNVKGSKFIRKNFVAIEAYYTRNKGNVNNTYLNSDGTSYEDHFVQDKNKYGLNAKIGKKIIMNSLMIEFAGGIGLAYLDVNHYNRENVNDSSYSSLFGFLLREGKYFRINTPMSFKIGIRF